MAFGILLGTAMSQVTMPMCLFQSLRAGTEKSSMLAGRDGSLSPPTEVRLGRFYYNLPRLVHPTGHGVKLEWVPRVQARLVLRDDLCRHDDCRTPVGTYAHGWLAEGAIVRGSFTRCPSPSRGSTLTSASRLAELTAKRIRTKFLRLTSVDYAPSGYPAASG